MIFPFSRHIRQQRERDVFGCENVPGDVMILFGSQLYAAADHDTIDIVEIAPSRSRPASVFILRHLLADRPELPNHNHLRRLHVDGEVVELSFRLAFRVLALANRSFAVHSYFGLKAPQSER